MVSSLRSTINPFVRLWGPATGHWDLWQTDGCVYWFLFFLLVNTSKASQRGSRMTSSNVGALQCVSLHWQRCSDAYRMCRPPWPLAEAPLRSRPLAALGMEATESFAPFSLIWQTFYWNPDCCPPLSRSPCVYFIIVRLVVTCNLQRSSLLRASRFWPMFAPELRALWWKRRFVGWRLVETSCCLAVSPGRFGNLVNNNYWLLEQKKSGCALFLFLLHLHG